MDWIKEIYLMHHFTANTSSSLVLGDRAVDKVWLSVVPDLALEYPFLTRGLLALSALHLAYLRPQEEARWTHIAFENQNKAIAAIQPIISDLSAQSRDCLYALFATLCTLTFSSLVVTKFATLRQTDGPVPVSDIISPALHTRGIAKISDVAGNFIQTGPLAPLIVMSTDDRSPESFTARITLTVATYIAEWRTIFSVAPRMSAAAKQLAHLRDVFRREYHTGNILNAIEESISTLEVLYAEVDSWLQRESHVWYPGLAWKWPVLLPQEYVTLLQANHPAALVVYAHFAILSLLFDEWYLVGYSERALASISAVLEEPWKALLEWPEEQMRGGLRDICDRKRSLS